MFIALARVAKPLTLVGAAVALLLGFPVGGEDLTLALLTLVAPLFYLRGLVIIMSRDARRVLANHQTYWLWEDYMPPTRAGGIQALVFGTWVWFFAIYGLVQVID